MFFNIYLSGWEPSEAPQHDSGVSSIDYDGSVSKYVETWKHDERSLIATFNVAVD